MKQQSQSNRRMMWVMGGLILLAWGLRLYRLDAPSLRGDEAFSITFSRHSLSEMFQLFTASTEPHPPLSFLVLHGWRLVAGESEFAMRLTSVWPGVLIAPLMYALGRALWDRRVGLVAAALVAINPFYIWHAQEARMYAWLVMFSVASTWLFCKLVHRADGQGGWHWSVWYGLVTACSIYIHYYTFLLLLFHGCYAIWVAIRERVNITRWLIGVTLAGALYLPWLMSSWAVLTAYQGRARSLLPFWAPVYRSVLAFGHGQTVPEAVSLWFLPLWGGLLIGGLAAAWWRDRRTAWFLTLYLALPWGIVFVDSLRRPAFDERYFMVSTPPFYILVALALLSLYRWRRVAAGAAVVLILGISGVSLYHHYHNPAFARAPDWRALSRFLAGRVRPDDVVVANYPDPAAAYYFRFDAPWLILPEAFPVNGAATVSRLDELAQTSRRIWLLPQRWDFWDADGLVEAWLNEQTEPVAQYQVDRFRVLLYHPFHQAATEMRPVDVQFEGGIRLLGYALRDETGQAVDELVVRPGDAVRLTLYWQAEATIGHDLVIFVHLLDETGWLRGQQDNPPRSGALPTRAWQPGQMVVDVYHVPLAVESPPGQYGLELGMYHPADGARVQVMGDGMDEANRRVLLSGLVRVSR